MKDLSAYQQNSYSQYGEDGIIAEILRRLSEGLRLDRWCVEFGAWDGIYLSNTCRLIREENYNAVLIEGDPMRVDQLKRNFPEAHVHKICRFVHFEGENTLDNILSEVPIPVDFDFLSIDVDGVDYHLFDGLKCYQPKVVCIEFNPTIPNAVDFVQPKDFSIKQGTSAKALARLAVSKGYRLVAATRVNLLLVREDLCSLVASNAKTLEELNPYGNDPQYLFVGFDGTILSNRSEVSLTWHGLTVPMRKLQYLPYFLRLYARDYGPLQKFAFKLFRALKKDRSKRKN